MSENLSAGSNKSPAGKESDIETASKENEPSSNAPYTRFVPFYFLSVLYERKEVQTNCVMKIDFVERSLFFYVKEKLVRRFNFSTIAKVELENPQMLIIYRGRHFVKLVSYRTDITLLYQVLYHIATQHEERIPFNLIVNRFRIIWDTRSFTKKARFFSSRRYVCFTGCGIYVYRNSRPVFVSQQFHSTPALTLVSSTTPMRSTVSRLPIDVPHNVITPDTPIALGNPSGYGIHFSPKDRKQIVLKAPGKKKLKDFIDRFDELKDLSVPSFREKHSFTSGRLNTLLPFARDMVREAMLAADECEENFELVCKLIKAVSKKRYATIAEKERILRHQTERRERDKLIKAYHERQRAMRKNDTLKRATNTQNVNTNTDYLAPHVSDLTSTPSPYTSSESSDTTQTATSELDVEQRRKRKEEERQHRRDFKLKEKQASEMMKIFHSVVKRENPEFFYRLDHMVGKGGYGEVFRARKEGTGEIVAYKTIKQTTDERMPKIAAEVGLLKKLKNDLLVNFFDVYQHKGQIVLIMEFLDGGSIKNFLTDRSEPFKEPDVAYVTFCVLKGLKFIHDKGYIHRDIKSANVMLTSNGLVKLIDLGLVVPHLPKPESRAGSKPYMAPEVILMKPYDKSCDVWSTGCVAQEMAETLPPYREFCLLRSMFRTATVGAQGLRKPENFSVAFIDFIAKCFAYVPSERATVEELLSHQFLLKQKDSALKRKGMLWTPNDDSLSSG